MIKPKFTNKTDIRLGFEVECVILIARESIFENEIRALNSSINISDDGSIITRRAECSYELQTPPLATAEAMTLLRKVFVIVNRYGHTNSSCGFHVNISSNVRKNMLNFNPFVFMTSPLWKKLLKSFERDSNSYCKFKLDPTKRGTSKVGLLQAVVEAGSNSTSPVAGIFNKYNCVNLSNFGTGRERDSRIEIRGMGNKDYSKKYELIAAYVKRIEQLFKISYNPLDFHI